MANVLIVEDEPAIARLLALSIDQSRHAVRIAPGLEQARSAIADGWPHVVSLDLRLGDEDGGALVDIARSHGFRGRFIIVSAHGAREAALRLGIADWMAKPFDPWLVADKIDQLAGDAGCPDLPVTAGA
jgi:DNA-binding response OmpR family regulator